MTTITIKPNFEAVIKRLTEELAGKETVTRILTVASNLLAGKTKRGAWAAEYPPETDRNRPPGHRGDGVWYQRGFGTRYQKRGFGVGGRPYYQGVGGRNTSERFQESWQTEIKGETQEFTAHVFTNVSYAPFLLDATKRPQWVNEVGWRTLDSIAEDFAPEFEKIILAEIDNTIKRK